MVKKETKQGNVPVSSLKTFQKSFETVEKEQISVLEELQQDLRDVSKKIDISVNTNISLQEVIAELMKKLTEATEDIKNISKTLRIPNVINGSAIEEQKEIMSPSIEPRFAAEQTPVKIDIHSQLADLVNQNRELTETLRELEGELKKSSTKDAIKKAVEKSRFTG